MTRAPKPGATRGKAAKRKPSETEVIAMLLAATGNPDWRQVLEASGWTVLDGESKGMWRVDARALLRALRAGKAGGR